MRGTVAVRLGVISIALFAAQTARAESAPPASAAQSACTGKAIGERCPGEGGRSGTCRASTCTRFEHWKTPATTTSFDCVTCITEGDASAGASGKVAKDGAKAGCASGPGTVTNAEGAGAFVIALGALVRRARGARGWRTR